MWGSRVWRHAERGRRDSFARCVKPDAAVRCRIAMRCRTGVRMALLAVVAFTGTARADRAAGERAAAEAERTQDPAAIVACGQAFLVAYIQVPTAANNDEVLFDAGRCFV